MVYASLTAVTIVYKSATWILIINQTPFVAIMNISFNLKISLIPARYVTEIWSKYERLIRIKYVKYNVYIPISFKRIHFNVTARLETAWMEKKAESSECLLLLYMCNTCADPLAVDRNMASQTRHWPAGTTWLSCCQLDFAVNYLKVKVSNIYNVKHNVKEIITLLCIRSTNKWRIENVQAIIFI